MNEYGLGRGLGALLPNTPIQKQEMIRELPIQEIVNRADQPRRYFDEESLSELAASIQEHGILQPILVRFRNGKYEIIAGERRWRAAKMLDFKTVPAVVREADDQLLPELALIENLQREDLGILEEAAAYQTLWESYGYTQEEIARRLGKGRVYISNTMRLLQLSTPVLAMLKAKEISAGHARVLLRITEEEKQVQTARQIVRQGLSVRQTENLVNRLLEGNPTKTAETSPEDLFVHTLEDRIQTHFGSKVRLLPNGKKGGKLELFYTSHEDLGRLLELMGIEED